METETTLHDREGWPEGGQDAASEQYAAIRDLWVVSQDGDGWGTLMGAYFAAAEVLYMRTGECVDSFSPGLGLAGDRRAVIEEGIDWEPEEWPAAELWEWIDNEDDEATRAAWIDALRDWCAWCSREADELVREGKDY